MYGLVSKLVRGGGAHVGEDAQGAGVVGHLAILGGRRLVGRRQVPQLRRQAVQLRGRCAAGSTGEALRLQSREGRGMTTISCFLDMEAGLR